MNVYEVKSMAERLDGNTYPGRGIVIGTSADGKKAVTAYAKDILDFLQNSPERIFKDDFEKAGYEAFLTEFNDLMEEDTL